MSYNRLVFFQNFPHLGGVIKLSTTCCTPNQLRGDDTSYTAEVKDYLHVVSPSLSDR